VTLYWPETQTGDAVHNTRNKECHPYLVCDVKISREVLHLCYIAILDQDSVLSLSWIYKTVCLQVMLPSVVHQLKYLHNTGIKVAHIFILNITLWHTSNTSNDNKPCNVPALPSWIIRSNSCSFSSSVFKSSDSSPPGVQSSASITISNSGSRPPCLASLSFSPCPCPVFTTYHHS